MRTFSTLIVAAAVGMSGCASMDMPSVPGLGASSASAPTPETFSYAPASDQRVRAQVSSVTTYRGPGFIPSDPNWVQIDLSFTNIGNRTVTLTRVQQRLADGTTVNAAQSSVELQKAPNFVREGLITTGLGVGGMAVGTLLFPPAAILAGAVAVFRPMFAGNRASRMIEEVNRRGLRVGPVAPDTTTNGLVFLPAYAGQTGLIVFYSEGGEDHALMIERN